MPRFIPLHRAIFTYFKDYFSYSVMKRVIFFKVQLCTPTFRNRKVGKILYAGRIVAWFERKKVIHCHAQPYSPTFRNRKGAQKIFAAQTPQRKRGFFSSHQTIVGKISKRLRNLLSSLADAPHCSMGLVSMHKLVDIILALMPCHVTVCVNFILGAKK